MNPENDPIGSDPVGSWRKVFDWLTAVTSNALTTQKALTPNDVEYTEVLGHRGDVERHWTDGSQTLMITFSPKKSDA